MVSHDSELITDYVSTLMYKHIGCICNKVWDYFRVNVVIWPFILCDLHSPTGLIRGRPQSGAVSVLLYIIRVQ